MHQEQLHPPVACERAMVLMPVTEMTEGAKGGGEGPPKDPEHAPNTIYRTRPLFQVYE